MVLEQMLPCLFLSARLVPQFPSSRSERLSSERGVTCTFASPLPKPGG